jgi:hypothetical protein
MKKTQTELTVEMLEEGVGMLDISVRTANALEDEHIFTIHDLLMKSLDRLKKIPNFGDKSFASIQLALRKKGFRRKGTGEYRSDQPIYKMYKDCKPQSSDPADLLESTPTIDEEDVELLTYKQTLTRAIAQLEDLQTNFRKRDATYKMLEWIIYYASTRLPEPEDEE